MTSSRPYVLRALYEWIVANQLTPHVLVNAMWPEVEVPQDYVKDGQIVLNLAPSAVQGLSLGNDFIVFNARFRGIPTDISVPVSAVMGIYARENGQGMMFETEEGSPPDGPTTTARPKGPPALKVVK